MICACLIPASARAQIVYANPIPNDLKTAPNTLTAAQMTVISNFVDAEITNLKSGKADSEKGARKALEDAAVAVGATATAPYLVAYATVLDQKLVLLESANQPLQVRLNAAIAMAHVAARVDNGFLKNAATAFALDHDEPVALWGVKAGKYIVPHLLDVGQAGPLDAAIINTVGSFKNDGAIVEDAYDDFTGDGILGGGASARITAAIDPLVKLMGMRAALYAAAQTAPAVGDAPDLPAEPGADKGAYSFISKPEIWKAAKPSQQQAMCRAGIDLIDQIIPLVDGTPARVLNVDPPEMLRKEDLIGVINHAGSAFKVVATLANEPAGGPIATAANALMAGQINAQTAGAAIKDKLSSLEAALTAANLEAPPVPLPPIPPKRLATPASTPARPAATGPGSRPVAPPTASRVPVGAAH